MPKRLGSALVLRASLDVRISRFAIPRLRAGCSRHRNAGLDGEMHRLGGVHDVSHNKGVGAPGAAAEPHRLAGREIVEAGSRAAGTDLQIAVQRIRIRVLELDDQAVNGGEFLWVTAIVTADRALE